MIKEQQLEDLPNKFRAGQHVIDNSRAAANDSNHRVFINNVSTNHT
jgi:hypothetical protein